MNPAGKTALITGGAQRVGKAISLQLARAGAHVAINYHSSQADAEVTVDEAKALGVRAMAIQADVSDLSQVQEMVSRVRDQMGSIDILVNNASLFWETPFPSMDVAAWKRVTGIGIHGPYYCANAVAPGMLATGEGVIINIADLSGWEPWPHFIAHATSKAALMALTRQLALELAPSVRVNAIAPGPVLPPASFNAARIERWANMNLLNRWGRPGDIAAAVLYFLESDYVTGNILRVDGGERYGHRKPKRDETPDVGALNAQ